MWQCSIICLLILFINSLSSDRNYIMSGLFYYELYTVFFFFFNSCYLCVHNRTINLKLMETLFWGRTRFLSGTIGRYNNRVYSKREKRRDERAEAVFHCGWRASLCWSPLCAVHLCKELWQGIQLFPTLS